MPKRIHKFYNCKQQGHRWIHITNVMTGIQKKENTIVVPGEATVETTWAYLVQCDVCKVVAAIPVVKEKKPDGTEGSIEVSNMPA